MGNKMWRPDYFFYEKRGLGKFQPSEISYAKVRSNLESIVRDKVKVKLKNKVNKVILFAIYNQLSNVQPHIEKDDDDDENK